MKAFAVLLVACLVAGLAFGEYSRTTALESFTYIRAAYCNPTLLADWTCPVCDGPLTNVTVFQNSSTGILSYTGYNPTLNRIVISWRGSSNIADWIMDLDAILMDYPSCAGCQVHQGFFLTFLSVWNYGMAEEVGNLVAGFPDAPILLTGHSLGAATAMHTAIVLAQDLPRVPQTYYTFGEPRIGNPAFVQWASTIMPHVQYRITHEADPVPHLPLISMGYLHVPHEVWFNNDGNTTYTVCNDSFTAEDPNCSDSVIALDGYNHVKYMGMCTGCDSQPDAAGHC